MSQQIRRLSRRAFLQWTGAGTALALAACAPATVQSPGTGEQAPAQAKTLEFWMWNTFAPPADEIMEQKLREWAAANNVTIEISRDSDGNQQTKVMPALEAGTLPDALFVGSGPALLMMDAGGTRELTDLFAEIGEAHGGWLPKLTEYVTREGEVHFLPYSIDTPMVQYRQDIFEEAGIQVPEGQWTWQETRDLCLQAQQFTEEQGKKMVGWGFGVVKQQHDGWCHDLFRNMGADLWDETGQNIILAEQHMEEATKALNFAKEAWDMGLFPDDAASWDWSSNNKAYQEDQAILVINAASIYVWATQNKPELAEVTGLAPKPKDVRDTTNAGLRYTVVMTKDVRDEATTLDLIRALYDKEIYAPWLEAGFVANVLHEYDDLPMWTGKRAQFNLAAQLGVYGGYPAPYDNAAMADLLGPNDPIGTMTVRVLLDGWTPEEAILEADQFSKDVFRRYF
ncbi:extracellular solute-binding protein [Litorilinea aerophila]|nr:extracellular solute-binding protein [Litorilinea aerophila]MCC9077816.1 extracellular solute-binding protein [Litorilinea aerophila]